MVQRRVSCYFRVLNAGSASMVILDISPRTQVVVNEDLPFTEGDYNGNTLSFNSTTSQPYSLVDYSEIYCLYLYIFCKM